MAGTQFTAMDDEMAEYVDEWSRLPHPLEAAVLAEVNEPGAVVTRAADAIHRRPPGISGPTRSVWVLAHCGRDGEGEPLAMRSWCWYATRAAAEAAEGCAETDDDTLVMHETAVPRSVRCDGVEEYLARNYLARSAEPRC